MIVVSDTSPITALLTIQKIDLLRQLYGEVKIPTAVVELAGGKSRLECSALKVGASTDLT